MTAGCSCKEPIEKIDKQGNRGCQRCGYWIFDEKYYKNLGKKAEKARVQEEERKIKEDIEPYIPQPKKKKR